MDNVRITMLYCFTEPTSIQKSKKKVTPGAKPATHIFDSATRLIAPFAKRTLIKPNPKQYSQPLPRRNSTLAHER